MLIRINNQIALGKNVDAVFKTGPQHTTPHHTEHSKQHKEQPQRYKWLQKIQIMTKDTNQKYSSRYVSANYSKMKISKWKKNQEKWKVEDES